MSVGPISIKGTPTPTPTPSPTPTPTPNPTPTPSPTPTSTPTPTPLNTRLSFTAGTSVKLEQILGDCDWQFLDWSSGKGTCKPTASQTATRFHILGSGEGYTWEDNGKLLYLNGDTLSTDENTYSFKGGDAIAYSTTTDGESPFFLTYYTKSDGTPLFVCRENSQCGGIGTGGDDIPNSGITLPDGVYLVFNTGTDMSLSDPHANDYSVLIRFDESAQTFTAGRTISKLQNGTGGHFIFTSLHTFGSDVYMYGVGDYRNSDIYLSKTPTSTFWAGTGTQYFAGFVNGQPTWSTLESAAVPVVRDNPLNDPNYSPTAGKMSVTYSSDLNLWLMTFEGGHQTQATDGAYFAYATQPWGPWATPQLIFNAWRDNGEGVFIHDPTVVPDPPGDGLNGPVGNGRDPYSSAGFAAGPLMIERFTRVANGKLKIYWVMSTWNPYTTLKMRSEIAIATPGNNPIDQADFFVRWHYYDFLNRAPDASGLSFWDNQITLCGTDQSCIAVKRINVSASFFLSIEFQQTGYLVERVYKVAFGDAKGTSTIGGAHQLVVPIVNLNQFLPDTQAIGHGVVVGQTGWETVLENNKQAFASQFVQRTRFTTAFPTSMTPAQFVNQLFANAGVTPSSADRNAAINEFGSATNTIDLAARGRALRDVAENSILQQQEFNRAFVLMQYFGYLRRNPNDPPEATLDYSGYDFWLNKLNFFNGNYIQAEMVKAFITSIEYRQRFGS